MIDHVAIKVNNFTESRAFYVKAFESLGFGIAFEEDGFCAFDIDGGLFELWQQKDIGPVTTTHVAFKVKTKQEIHAFFESALAAGGRDNGAPGPRPKYTENYYACFVLDPSGHNIEVMWDI